MRLLTFLISLGHTLVWQLKMVKVSWHSSALLLSSTSSSYLHERNHVHVFDLIPTVRTVVPSSRCLFFLWNVRFSALYRTWMLRKGSNNFFLWRWRCLGLWHIFYKVAENPILLWPCLLLETKAWREPFTFASSP